MFRPFAANAADTSALRNLCCRNTGNLILTNRGCIAAAAARFC